MKFIIGLGNVGKKYDDTRHNAGFMAVDSYVHANDLGEWKEQPKFKAHIIRQTPDEVARMLDKADQSRKDFSSIDVSKDMSQSHKITSESAKSSSITPTTPSELRQRPANGVFYIKPTTYMNLSGQTIAMGMAFYNVQPEDILIIHDDVDIEFGKIRTRQGGGDGGHNGIKSLPNSVQERAWRLRIGVKNEYFDQTDTAKFVLDRFSKKELGEFDRILKITNSQIGNFVSGSASSQTISV